MEAGEQHGEIHIGFLSWESYKAWGSQEFIAKPSEGALLICRRVLFLHAASCSAASQVPAQKGWVRWGVTLGTQIPHKYHGSGSSGH